MEKDDKTVFVNYEKQIPDDTLEMAYMELGRAYYEGKFEDPLPELLPMFDKITKLKNPSAAEALCPGRSATVCPSCSAAVEEDAIFCGNCGYRLQ